MFNADSATEKKNTTQRKKWLHLHFLSTDFSHVYLVWLNLGGVYQKAYPSVVLESSVPPNHEFTQPRSLSGWIVMISIPLPSTLVQTLPVGGKKSL